MTYQPTAISNDQNTLPQLPAWVTSGRAETLETVAFRSGAALAVLDQLVADPRHGVPVRLLGSRLALTAATAISKLEGRLAREEDIRDAYHLTPPGEARGPDGDLLAFWREAVRIRMGRTIDTSDLIGPDLSGDVEGWRHEAQSRSLTHGPLAGCASVMRAVVEADDRAERIACLHADVFLARVLSWKTVLPITAQRLSKAKLRDLVAVGQGGELIVQQCLLESVEDTIRLARDLATRAASLRAIAPKLRAKGSEAAVALFLSEDAVARRCCMDQLPLGTRPPRDGIQALRSNCGRPRPVIRLSTWTLILASVF